MYRVISDMLVVSCYLGYACCIVLSRICLLYRVISDMLVVPGKTTLTISDSIETVSPEEFETVRVFYLSSTAITEASRVNNKNTKQCSR